MKQSKKDRLIEVHIYALNKHIRSNKNSTT